MVQIVIIEPHLLLRLGLTSLMTCLTGAERIKSQTYDDLYQSPPRSAPTDLVLLGAHPEERINLLIQAARRAHAPRRLVLLSEPTSYPAAWTNLPSLVTDYISTTASAESILSTVHSLLHKSSGRNSPGGHPLPRGQAVASASLAPIAAAPFQPPLDRNVGFKFEKDEAGMLGLSTRQYEVLLLLAQGHPIKVICRELNITMATTKGHLEALYLRLGVHNRNEAVFVAMARGATLKMPDPAPQQP